MGNSYQGCGRWFFPFRASENPGPVLMTLNADEKAGKLTFEPFSNGQALSPLQAALVKGSPYARCGKVPVQHSSEQPPDPTPAAAATPVAWTNLPAMVGKYQGDFDLFGSGAIAAELKRPPRSKADVDRKSVQVGSPLRRYGDLYYHTGHPSPPGGPHQAT